MRLLALAALLFTLLPCLFAPSAQATTYSSWYSYSLFRGGQTVNCRWRAMADVLYPHMGYVFPTTTGSGSTAKGPVPHAGWHGFFLEAFNPPGLPIHQYTMVGSLQRWDTGGNFWRGFNDQVFSNWHPPVPDRLSYNRQWRNPYSALFYYEDLVYVSPLGQNHLCDAQTSVTNHNLNYWTLSAYDRILYSVRP